MKGVENQNLRTLELSPQYEMSVPLWIIEGFQQRDEQNSEYLNNDTFCRLPVTSARSIIGT